MKKITALFVALLLIIFSLSGCGTQSTLPDEELVTTPNQQLLLSQGIVCEVEDLFSYEVIEYNGDQEKVIHEAEKLVRKWWNDDETFHTPEFVWVTIHSGNIRGFQDTGYIFLDPSAPYEDLLATTVHEWLHELVSPTTLIDQNGLGRPVMEMVVEAITVDIMEGYHVEATDNFLYFRDTPGLWNHKAELIDAFRAEEGFAAYERILGVDYQKIILDASVALS